VSKHHNMKA